MTDDSKPFVTPFGSQWLPSEEPPAGQRAARHRLAAALRRTIALLMDADAPESEIERAAEATEQFADHLATFPQDRALWGYAEASTAGSPRAFFDSSPLIGLSNAIAPPLHLTVNEDSVEGTAVFETQYEGPPGHVHGGFVAAAFDEVLGLTQSLAGQSGMTGTLTIRYRRPTPLHRELHFIGKVDHVEGRKIFTTAQLFDGETLCAEAEGIFIAIDFERFRQMAVSR